MVIPQDYTQWRHCITAECHIELIPEFIAKRLTILRDTGKEETRRFRKLYGDRHWQSIVSWYERAQRELDSGA